jgi:hypothetical protein
MGRGYQGGRGEAMTEAVFFFEKKNQKTFALWHT